MAYLVHILTLGSIYGILALSLNLLVGYTGLISLAHAAFFGIGAYAAAIALTAYGFSFVPALLVGCVFAAGAGVLIGSVLSRFRDDYYMLVSLGFTSIVTAVFVNASSLTGGPFGIAGIPRPSAAASEEPFLLLCFFFLIATALLSWWITRSSFGRALRGIREDEEVMQVLGYPTQRYKLLIFVIAATLASVSGALYASYVSFIDPKTFSLNESIVILSMIILGGLSSLRGSLVGAVFLVALPEVLRFAGFPSAVAGQMRELVFGMLLVILMLCRPQGMLGQYRL